MTRAADDICGPPPPWNELASGESALDTQIGGSHYKSLPIQPVEFSERNELSFLEGCVVKRVCRHSRGGKGRQDIEKAIHELQLILALHYPAKEPQE